MIEGTNYVKRLPPPPPSPLAAPLVTGLPRVVDLHSRFVVDLTKEASQGNFGKVYPAIERKANQPVALKILHDVNDESQNEVELLKELSKQCHPNVLCFIDFFRSLINGTYYYVIETELLEKDLEAKNIAWKNETLLKHLTHAPVEFACRVTRGLLEGLAFLHRNEIYHLDLKPSNVMLRANGEPVIIDFGLSISCANKDKTVCSDTTDGDASYFSVCRWRCWLDANLCSIDEKKEGDVWALGLTLLAAFTRDDKIEQFLIQLVDQQKLETANELDAARLLFYADASVSAKFKQYAIVHGRGMLYPPDPSINALLESILITVPTIRCQLPSADQLLTMLRCDMASDATQKEVLDTAGLKIKK